MKLSKVLNEDYKIYHKSFSSAAQAAVKMATKKGYEVDQDDFQSQVVMVVVTIVPVLALVRHMSSNLV